MTKTIITGIILAGLACTPSVPSIQNTIQQSFQAANLSILSQVDWKQVMTHLSGKIGPDFELVAEGYTKTSVGIHFRVRGGEVSIDTQAQGGGGNQLSPEMFEALNQVQQRWERADDKAKADRGRWASEVSDAILDAVLTKEKQTTTAPAEPSPSGEPVSSRHEGHGQLALLGSQVPLYPIVSPCKKGKCP